MTTTSTAASYGPEESSRSSPAAAATMARDWGASGGWSSGPSPGCTTCAGCVKGAKTPVRLRRAILGPRRVHKRGQSQSTAISCGIGLTHPTRSSLRTPHAPRTRPMSPGADQAERASSSRCAGERSGSARRPGARVLPSGSLTEQGFGTLHARSMSASATATSAPSTCMSVDRSKACAQIA
jgi:hypothetical protein